MTPRQRDAQEMRNGVEVMTGIEHLSAHPEVPFDLNLICYSNKLVLQNTDRDYWAGRPRAAVDWQAPADWSCPRAVVSPAEPGLAVEDVEPGELILHRNSGNDPSPIQTVRRKHLGT